jgi:hypothetical protein
MNGTRLSNKNNDNNNKYYLWCTRTKFSIEAIFFSTISTLACVYGNYYDPWANIDATLIITYPQQQQQQLNDL